MVTKAARAFTRPDFYQTFNEIATLNPACADYLTEIGFEHWTRSHFTGNRYNIMTSNVAESWNAVLREAREYPIVPLVEFIRSKLMCWFSDRRDYATTLTNRLTPRVMELLACNFEVSAGFAVKKINDFEYDVRDKDGTAFHVNLTGRSCSCREFQCLMIPCPHAVAAAVCAKISVESLVSLAYSTMSLAAAYEKNIAPVTGVTKLPDLPTEFEFLNLDVAPPATRRPPGRPRKSRILSCGEIRVYANHP